MEFSVLGPLEVRHNGQQLPLGGAQQRALLAILLTQANRVVVSDRLADLLWGDAPPATADHVLAVYISNLRHVLEPGGAPYRLLVRRGQGYTLAIAADQLDSARFEALVESAKNLPPERKAAELAGALGMWRGGAYADFTSHRFAVAETARLEELRLHALEERIEADLALGRHQQLIGELEALVGDHPLRERLAGQLMLALYRSGRQAEASAVYQRTRLRLVDEVGMEPGPELQARLTRILKQDPKLALAEEPRSHLPVQLTSFVGRESEVEEVGSLVRQFRIVTLTGGGGSGKTRLAIEVGAIADESFPDGVWFADLSAVTEGEFVLQAIAGSIGLTEQAGRALLATVSDHLATRVALLILDNCEQVVDAAASAAAALLDRCRTLHVLATSRERLGIEGERIHRLPPLAVPAADSIEELQRCEAAELLVDRARLSVPGFSLTERNASAVAELCRRLDGIPLAIELAAARIGALSPDEILARLSDQPGILASAGGTRAPRQRSLSATLEWSYRLLEPAEAALFRRLSVFSGGFYLDAAESIGVDERIKSTEIPGLVVNLCNKSLLVPEERSPGRTRYRMLETVRTFATDCLEANAENHVVRARHAALYLELVDGAKAGIQGGDAHLWLDLMEIEHDNARAALSWSVVNDRDRATQLAIAWTPFWMLRGHRREGRHWLAAVLDGTKDECDWTETPDAAYRLAEAKQAAAQFAESLGDPRGAQSYAQEALQIGKALGDKGITAALSVLLAGLAAHRGEPSLAQSLAEESLADLRDAGAAARLPGFASAAALEAAGSITLATVSAQSGDFAAARSHYLKALEYAERTGGRPLVSVAIGLGEVALVDRDLPLAGKHFAAALEVARSLRDRQGISVSLHYCAGLAAASSKPLVAIRLQGASSRVFDELGLAPLVRAGHPSERTVIPLLAQVYRQLGKSEAEFQLEAGRAMATEDAIAYALEEVLG